MVESLADAKSITLILEQGNIDGVISLWTKEWPMGGILYAAPRNDINVLMKLEESPCNRGGVYLLVSNDRIYVGQSTNIGDRIKNHQLKKEWWDKVIIFTTTDDSLLKDDLDYLEDCLIKKTFENKTIESDNKKNGNSSLAKVQRERRINLEKYLKEALLLVRLVGVTTLENIRVTQKKQCKKEKAVTKNKKNSEIIRILDKKEFRSKNRIIEDNEKRNRDEIKEFLKEKGIRLGDNYNIAKLNEKKNCYRSNPRINVLEKDWFLVLNNCNESKLLIIKIPANTFKIRNGSNKADLRVRPDKPLIDLELNSKTLVAGGTKCDFSKFIIKEIKY